MTTESLPLSTYACFYLLLSKPRRRIFQYLRWHNSRYPNSFPKMSAIARFAGISERAVQRFFEILREKNIIHNYLAIKSRKNKFGGSSTNEYVVNKNFKLAMDWLSIHGKLDAPKKHTERIISSMQKEEKVHPPTPEKFTPSSVFSSIPNSQTLRKSVWLHPKLENIKIDMAAKIYASKYAPEAILMDTLEACWYQQVKLKKKIDNPSSYFMGVLRNKMKGAKRNV